LVIYRSPHICHAKSLAGESSDDSIAIRYRLAGYRRDIAHNYVVTYVVSIRVSRVFENIIRPDNIESGILEAEI
jgi:hypothetical protein